MTMFKAGNGRMASDFKCAEAHGSVESNTPQQADGVSSLIRSKLKASLGRLGIMTLAAFAKCSRKRGTWLIARGNKRSKRKIL